MITLYDLAASDPGIRFSPYCWRTRLALAHKGLAVETVPWRFLDRPEIAFSGQAKVPVIRDGDTVVFDSWDIAVYLDTHYPAAPTLMGAEAGRAHLRFINAWADTILLAAIAPMIILDIWKMLDPKDQPYFRESREARFGVTLEALQEGREGRLPAFRQLLLPVRRVLQSQAWLGGDGPSYADYIVFGCLQWARCCSRFELLAENDPVAAWRERVMGLFGGLAAQAPRAA